MTVIDLGDVTRAGSGLGGSARLDHRRLVRAVLAVLTIAGLLALHGSARTETHGVRPLWTAKLADTEIFLLDEHTAYLNRMAGGRSQVAALDLETGAVRWTADTGTAVTGFAADPALGAIIVPVDPVEVTASDPAGGFVSIDQFGRATVALDPATGRELWRTTGDTSPDRVDAHTVLVSERDSRGGLTRLRLLGLHDGRELWSRPVPGATNLAVTDDEIMTIDGKGTGHVYAHGDGSLRRTGQLRWAGDGVEPGQFIQLTAAGGYFVVIAPGDEAARATVYRPADLHPLWSVDATRGFIQDCAPLLCTFGQEGVSAHDPVTGRVLWRQPTMAVIHPLSAERLLLDESNGDTLASGLILVDPGTGRQIGAPIHGKPVPTSQPWPSVLFLRATTKLGQVAVVRLDVATGTAATLGVTTSPGGRPCESTGRYLACSQGGTLAVMGVG